MICTLLKPIPRIAKTNKDFWGEHFLLREWQVLETVGLALRLSLTHSL